MNFRKNVHYWLRGLQEHDQGPSDPVLDYAAANAPHKGLGNDDKLELLANAARLVLFTEPGSSEEYQAVYNLGFIMSTYVDADKSSAECRKAVVDYAPAAPSWRQRLAIAWDFVRRGRTSIHLERSSALADWS